MDLKTFVAETLTQIVAGVSQAQRDIAALGTNAAVNPASVASDSSRQMTGARPVEFDVALTVVDRSSSSVEANDSQSASIISVVHSGTEAGSSSVDEQITSQEAVSRVKFSVLLAQPGDISVYQKPNLAALGRSLA
jgi:hypothetical protein